MAESRRVETASRPLEAEVRVPGSKSETVRAVLAASMAPGESEIISPLMADDVEAACRAAVALGAHIEHVDGAARVRGGTAVRPGGTYEVDAGESGLTARIALAMGANAAGSTRVVGSGRLPQRPMGGLIRALRAQGAFVLDSGGTLPVLVSGRGLEGGLVEVDCSESSQFATALMMAAPLALSPVTVVPTNLAGAGYLEATCRVMSAFGAPPAPVGGGYHIPNNGYIPGTHVIEGDASAAVYPMVATAIRGGRVRVLGVEAGSDQPDMAIAGHLSSMGCLVHPIEGGVAVERGGGALSPIDADLSNAPDGALALAVACMFARGPSRITGLSSLRGKESDRLDALASELARLGAEAKVDGEELQIIPGPLRPAVVDPHGDHRIAMAFALVGLVVQGVEVGSPGVVSKTWPGFWAMLDGLSGRENSD